MGKESLFVLKCGNQYFGLINCLGQDVMVHTIDLLEASGYYEEEVQHIQSGLQKQGINAVAIPYEEEKRRSSASIGSWRRLYNEGKPRARRTTRDITPGRALWK